MHGARGAVDTPRAMLAREMLLYRRAGARGLDRISRASIALGHQRLACGAPIGSVTRRCDEAYFVREQCE